MAIKRKNTNPYPVDPGERKPYTIRRMHPNGVVLPQGNEHLYRKVLYLPGDVVQLSPERAARMSGIVEPIEESVPQAPARGAPVEGVETRAVESAAYDVTQSHPRVAAVAPRKSNGSDDR